jgi:hypothetical protein
MNEMPDNTFKSLPDDAEVESRARAIFKAACVEADSYHTLRLGLARRKALHAGARHSTFGLWASVTGMAACCALVAGVVWTHSPRPANPGVASVSSASVAPVQADDEQEVPPEIGSSQMEMVEDLDFYRWVATQPAVASAPSRGAR